MTWLLLVLGVLLLDGLHWPWSTNRSSFLPVVRASAACPRGCQSPLLPQEPRENAAIVLLLRESDLDELLPTLDNFEDTFNGRFRYPYVFIGSPDLPPFSDHFIDTVKARLPHDAAVEFAIAPPDHWRIPDWLDEDETRAGFAKQAEQRVQYAGREGYHHMCRWYSGLFAREGVLAKYDWYWRLEPGVRFYNKVTYDPFRFMAVNEQVYGFVITIVETPNTIPTLFETVQRYIEENDITPDERLWEFLTTHRGTRYSLCHFWTNFEIGDLRFFRSEAYQSFFNYLDQAGGFYTERWGDAPIRSLALALLSSIDKVHYFEDFAYKHDWFMHCPRSSSSWLSKTIGLAKNDVGCDLKCPPFSPAAVDIDNDIWYSCLPRWKAAVAM